MLGLGDIDVVENVLAADCRLPHSHGIAAHLDRAILKDGRGRRRKMER